MVGDGDSGEESAPKRTQGMMFPPLANLIGEMYRYGKQVAADGDGLLVGET